MYDEDIDYRSRQNRHSKVKGRADRADCPACLNSISVGGRPRVGMRVVCPDCKTQLEVVWQTPLELDILAEDPFDEDEYGED